MAAKKKSRNPGLEKRIFSLDFKGGLNQLDAEHTLNAAYLLSAENAVYDKRGSLNKRAGHDDLSNTVVGGGSQTSLANGEQIAKYKNGVIAFDGKKAFRRVDGGNWLAGEEIVDVKFDQQGTSNARNMSQSNAQIVTLNNRVFTAWAEHNVRDGGAFLTYKIYLTVRDASTDAILLNRHEVRSIDVSTTIIAPAYHIPRVQLTYGGDYVAVMWAEDDGAGNGDIKAVTVDSTVSVISGTSAVFKVGADDLYSDYWVFTVTHINHPAGATDRICFVQTKFHSAGVPKLVANEGTLGDGSFSSAGTKDIIVTPTFSVADKDEYRWDGVTLTTLDSNNLLLVGYTNTASFKYAVIQTTSGGGWSSSAVHTDTVITSRHVLNMSAVIDPGDATRIRACATLAGINLKGYSYNHAQSHSIVMFSISSGSGDVIANSVEEVAHYVSLHTDLFAQDGYIYGVFSQGYRPKAAGDYKWFNSRNILVQLDFSVDGSANPVYRLRPMAAGRWGECAINYAVDFNFAAYDGPGTTAISGAADPGTAAITGSIDTDGSVNIVGVDTLFTTQLIVGDVLHIQDETKTVASIADNTHLITSFPFSDLVNETQLLKAVPISTTLVGTSSNFTGQLVVGDVIHVNDEKRTVDAIASNTSLTTTEAFTNTGNDTTLFKDIGGDTESAHPLKRQMYSLQRVQSLGSGEYRYGSSRWAGEWVSGSSPHNLAETNIEFINISSDQRYLPALEAAGSLFVGGGFLWEYSGDRFKEHGFFTGTEIIELVPHLNGNLSAGVYSFKVVLEWTAPNGDIQQSAPSEPAEFTAAEGNGYTLLIHTPQFSYKHPNFGLTKPRVVVYRTAADEVNYKRDVSTDLDTSAWSQNITFAGSTDDEVLTHDALYTEGGKFANVAPPSITDLAFHKERIMAATIDNDVWYSKRIIDGLAPEFTDVFMLVPRDRTEEITAIASNGEAFLIFSENNGYYIAGNGPNNNYTSGNFSEPRIFSPGVGATKGSPTLEYRDGVLAILNGGLHTIGRNLTINYAGGGVKDLEPLDAKALLLRDDRKEVQLLLKGALNNLDIVVYNTLYKQVTTIQDSNIEGYGAGAVMVGNNPHYLVTNGIELVENTDFFDDTDQGSEAVGMVVKTGWIKVGLLQQLQRAYRLLIYLDVVTPHTLNVRISYDYADSPAETKTLALTSTGPEFLRLRLNQQKCRAIMVEIYDSATSGVSREAFTLHGLALELGLRGGTFKVNAGRELS